VVLASSSPRRSELLAMLGVDFIIDVADVDETPHADEAPSAMVQRLALDKARVVAKRHGNALVIGADTTVDLDAMSLGKPADHAEAHAMLRSLSGRSHVVHTGVAVITPDGEHSYIETATVWFDELHDDDIARYIDSGEPMGKAGAYAIQGIGGSLITRLDGNLHAVIGLPLDRLRRILR
jgi:septum formation protein